MAMSEDACKRLLVIFPDGHVDAATLIAESGYSRSSVSLILSQLRERGVIECIRAATPRHQPPLPALWTLTNNGIREREAQRRSPRYGQKNAFVSELRPQADRICEGVLSALQASDGDYVRSIAERVGASRALVQVALYSLMDAAKVVREEMVQPSGAVAYQYWLTEEGKTTVADATNQQPTLDATATTQAVRPSRGRGAEWIATDYRRLAEYIASGSHYWPIDAADALGRTVNSVVRMSEHIQTEGCTAEDVLAAIDANILPNRRGPKKYLSAIREWRDSPPIEEQEPEVAVEDVLPTSEITFLESDLTSIIEEIRHIAAEIGRQSVRLSDMNAATGKLASRILETKDAQVATHELLREVRKENAGHYVHLKERIGSLEGQVNSLMAGFGLKNKGARSGEVPAVGD